MNLYQLNDEADRLLTLDNFLGGLTVPEFVDQLSSDHSTEGGNNKAIEYFDPKPYIRTFESTLSRLEKLKDDCSKRKERSETEVSNYELEHSSNVIQILSQSDTLRSIFHRLDDDVNKVSGVIGPLGENLLRGVRTKENLTLTIFLIRCYNSFYKSGKCSMLEELRNSEKQADKRKCATTVSQLLKLSEKLVSDDLNGSAQCHQLILKYAETLEQDLLEICNSAYKDQDYLRMKEHADMLFSFNGGSGVIQLFINNSELFMHFQSIDQNSLQRDPIWNELGQVDKHKFQCDQGTIELFDFIRMTIKGESRAITRVFEDTAQVLKVFMERIYAQLLSTRVQVLLKHAMTRSHLSYVRLLYTLYISIGEVTKDLKDFLVTDELDDDGELAATLDQCYSDLFVGYFSQNKYFEVEKKALEDVIFSSIAKFEMINEKLIRDQKLTMRIKNFEKNSSGNNVNNSIGTPTSATFQEDNSSHRFSMNLYERGKMSSLSHFINSHLERSSSIKDRQRQMRDHALKDLDTLNMNKNNPEGQLKFDKIKSTLLSTLESLSRIMELAPSKAAEYLYEIIQVVIVGIGKSYIDVGLEVAYTAGIVQQDIKQASLDFGYLKVVNLTNEMLTMITSLVKSVIIPLTINFPNIKNQIQKLINSYLTRCEVALTFILKDTLQLIGNKISLILSKQRKKDFLPKDDIGSQDNTELCEETCEFLSTMYHSLLRIFGRGSENLNNFLTEIGDLLLNKILDHLKNFQINEAGGLILTTDMVRYQSVVAEFRIESINEDYIVLREIANLFTVQPELLSSLTKEGQLLKLKPYLIRQFIMRRSDYSMSQSERFLSGI